MASNHPQFTPPFLGVRVKFGALSTAGLTNTVAMGTLPAGAHILGHSVQIVTAFAAPAITDLDLEIGETDTPDPNAYATAGELMQGGTGAAAAKPGTLTGAANGAAVALSSSTAHAVEALFTAVGANLDTLTAGECEIRLYYFDAARKG